MLLRRPDAVEWPGRHVLQRLLTMVVVLVVYAWGLVSKAYHNDTPIATPAMPAAGSVAPNSRPMIAVSTAASPGRRRVAGTACAAASADHGRGAGGVRLGV
jgi:hypothetical protein